MHEVIALLGEVAELQEQEDDAPIDVSETSSDKNNKKDLGTNSTEQNKKLYRDSKRKMLGGVASGISNYFGIDAVFVRLIFVILVLGVHIGPFLYFSGFSISFSSFSLLSYIALWVLLPASADLEDKNKLFRDKDDSMVGGVASGIAHYLGIDTIYIRLIFLALVFLGGSGILIYFLLWVTTPEARTVAEKVQMQGQPLTVDNIERKIKSSLNYNEKEDDQKLLFKILFFPIKLFGVILNSIGPVLKTFILFIINLVRFGVGFGILSMAIFIGFAITITLAIFFGMSVTTDWVIGDLPLDLLNSSLPPIAVLSLFVVAIIPTIFFALLGISLIINKNTFKPLFLGLMFGIWILGIGTVAYSSVNIISEFKTKETLTNKQELEYNYSKLYINTNAIEEKMYKNMEFNITPYEGNTLQIITKITAFGKSSQDAISNAEMINYSYNLSDSTLIFDNNFSFKDSAKFRFQNVKMEVFIPKNVEYITSESFEQSFGNGASKGFQIHSTISNSYHNKDKKLYEIQPFNKLNINGAFNVIVHQSDKDSIIFYGNPNSLESVKLTQNNDLITIDFENGSIFNIESNKINVEVWSKNLTSLDLNGAVDAKLKDITSNTLELIISGASDCKGNITVDKLDFEIAGASDLDLKGKANQVKGELAGTSDFDGIDLITNTTNLELSGACDAEIWVNESLTADLSGACELKYKGNPKTQIETSGASSYKQLKPVVHY